MSEQVGSELDASVLGQLLLMQSVLAGLPDERSIFGFAARGLAVLPGVARAYHRSEHEPPIAGTHARFPISGSAQSWGEFVVELDAPTAFGKHEPYVRNFVAMVALILDERAERALNLRHNEELESRVRFRTHQLTQEIAERRTVEIQLQRNRDMLESTLNAVPQAVFWKDCEGRYLGCNRAFIEAVGLKDSSEVVGLTDADLPWRPEDREGYLDHDRRVIASGQPEYRLLEHLRRADGTLRWVETTKVPLLDANGKPYSVLGVFEDVTEQLQADRERESLQSQLAQAQKMESVGRLAGGVAHDFNNMLQVIIGNTGLAMMEPGLPHAVREHLEEVKKAAERSSSLTQQLLAFARKQTVAPRVLDLNETIQRMLKMLQRLIGAEIQLDWEPAEHIWPVKIDPAQIDQVLANLVVNARDAIRGNGRITIRTRMVTWSGNDPGRPSHLPLGDYVSLTVADTGTGLSAEARAHLFEPFFTTKPIGQGTGLGLATVYGIVKQNGGFIDVSSKPGQRTEFSVYLPRTDAPVEKSSALPAPAPRGGKETLLLVEDEEQVLALAQRILERSGYVVLTATHPAQALRLVENHPHSIDLLITDVIMPGMNGRELYKNVERLKPGVRCLFMSGYPADILTERNRSAAPQSHFLAKPFTAADLIGRVREVLDLPVGDRAAS